MTFKHKLSARLARLWHAACLVTLVALVATACELRRNVTAPGADPATQLRVAPKALTVYPNQTAQLMAVGFTSSGDTGSIAVSWSVTGGTIIETSTNGGRHYGRFQAGSQTGTFRAVARVSSLPLADTAVVAVTPVPVAAVTVSPAVVSTVVGASMQLAAVVQDSGGNALSGRVVNWSSSAPAVATVSVAGMVGGGTTGSAIITATSEGKSGTSTVTVGAPPPPAPVASVTVSPASASVPVGGPLRLTATPRDAAGNPLAGRGITWASNNVAVATVSSSGLVMGVAAGSVQITATSEGQTGGSGITVTGGQGSLITNGSLVFAVPEVAKPGYLAPIVPGPFGTKVTRIAGDPGTTMTWAGGTGTWGPDARHHYSKDQPWNADGTLLALQNRGGGSPDMIFLDGETYQPKFGRCSGLRGDDRWHPNPAHARERIAVPGSELMWFDVVSCTKTRSWTLPFSVNGLGAGEGNPSLDGRFVALFDASRMFVVDMDPQPPFPSYPNKRIGPAVGLPSGGVDWVSSSPSGKYVVVQITSGPAQVYDVDRATLALTPRPMPATYPGCGGTAAQGWIYELGHGDMTLNPFDNNEDVMVGEELCGNSGKVVDGRLLGRLALVRLRDGVVTSLSDPTNEGEPHHVSTRSHDRLGWAYVGYRIQVGTRFTDEIVAVRLDGSNAVERLVHMHSDVSGCYRCEAHGVPSPDGLRALWASNWALNGGSSPGIKSVIQAYVVDTRASR